ncbi:AraC family transcriptional regulator [Tengunoibacter tsumagoiensis]|uniref:AraC family transcriptional regulator n=1 Tax=Tengunoibacter tsumagoiensis TaxID=2014871 RepID=UPI0013871559|nr:AraC family transcriptional regulator [Tengunoibacter tsumagoiensis]
MKDYVTFFPLISKHAQEHLLTCSIAGFAKTLPDEQLFRSHVPGYEIFYVTAGQGKLFVENASYPFKKGDLILLNLQANHGYRADRCDPYEFFYLNFQCRDLAHLPGGWLHLHNPLILQMEHEDVEPLFTKILEHVERQQSCWEAQVSALIYFLLMQFYGFLFAHVEHEMVQPTWVAQVKLWIEQHLEQRLTVETLATIAAISTYHFIREFKKYVHVTPLEYVISRRVTRAKYLLMKSDQSIEHIGRIVGFPSHASMIHHFKRLEGKTPSAFRASIQGLERGS